MNFIKNIISTAKTKILTKEVILYVLFGILTTIINIGTFYILTNFFNTNENLANISAIILAVLFAYISNRKLVFNSTASSFKEKIIEMFKFFLARLFTMVIEFFGFILLFNILHIPSLYSKTLITIIVIIANFFLSKFFAFKQ
ncbi:MAG: GtrA family protein [Clostridiales bacterium]|nr:GtrA family protein [Clostridiales bacterium]